MAAVDNNNANNNDSKMEEEEEEEEEEPQRFGSKAFFASSSSKNGGGGGGPISILAADGKRYQLDDATNEYFVEIENALGAFDEKKKEERRGDDVGEGHPTGGGPEASSASFAAADQVRTPREGLGADEER